MHSEPAAARWSWSWPRDGAVVFAVALAVRLACLLQLEPMPFFSHLVGDSKVYWDWAGRIAAGEAGQGTFYQAPLYPFFLGLLRALCGPSIVAAYVVQSMLGAAACALLCRAGAALFSRRAGLVAGLMLALYAPAIFADLLIQKETLAVFLSALLAWLLARAIAAPPRWQLWPALGATLGLLALTRENALVWIPLVFAWLLFAAARARAALTFTLGLGLVLSPALVHNHRASGEWLLTTSQLGSNLYIGNGEGSDGTYVALSPGRGNALFEREDATRLAERAAGRPLLPGEVSAYWTQRTLQQLRAHPGAALRLMLAKTLYVLNAYELPDTQDLYFCARWSWLLRGLLAVWHFGVLLPLATIGALLCWPRRGSLWIFAALSLSLAASVVAFFVVARYRLPLLPMLMLFAAAALVELPSLRGRTLAISGLLAAAVAIVANVPVYPRAPRDAMAWYNWGVVLDHEGRAPEAMERYRTAVQLWPPLAEAHYNLGNLYRKAGLLPEAQASLEAAVRARPIYSEAWNNLGLVLRDRHQLRAAVDAVSKSLQDWPGNDPARRNLQGLREAALRQGDAALAEEIARRQALLPAH